MTTSELFALQPIAHTRTGTQRVGKFKKVKAKKLVKSNISKKNFFRPPFIEWRAS